MNGPPADPTRAFRPSGDFEPVNGLAERVMPLVQAGRFRSALRPILEVLDDDPRNEHALLLAVALFSQSGTAHREAAEPLTTAEWNDARLDAIFAECSQCRKATWVPQAYMLPVRDINITNPLGMQCYACGHTLCRNCARSQPSWGGLFSEGDVQITRMKCVACRREVMSPVVYPTGRARRELRRPGTRITQVFLFRSGPVPPDVAYLQEVLPVVCSQAMEDQAGVRVFAQFPWPDNIADIAVFCVLQAIDQGELPPDALEHALATPFVDQDQTPGYLLAIAMPR